MRLGNFPKNAIEIHGDAPKCMQMHQVFYKFCPKIGPKKIGSEEWVNLSVGNSKKSE